MNGFEYVNGSYERYPEDQYTAESVVICFEGKFRVTYVRKKSQKGGTFWDVISSAVAAHGEKKYLKAFAQDSKFLDDDLKHFLDSRGWEKTKKGGQVAAEVDGLPF